MSEAIYTMSVKRRRHRTSRRKLLDNVLMIVATLAAMFLVAAFSIELIEYQPLGEAPLVQGQSDQAKARIAARRSGFGRHRGPLGSDSKIQWDNPRLAAE